MDSSKNQILRTFLSSPSMMANQTGTGILDLYQIKSYEPFSSPNNQYDGESDRNWKIGPLSNQILRTFLSSPRMMAKNRMNMMEVDLVMVYRATSMYSKLHWDNPTVNHKFKNYLHIDIRKAFVLLSYHFRGSRSGYNTFEQNQPALFFLKTPRVRSRRQQPRPRPPRHAGLP